MRRAPFRVGARGLHLAFSGVNIPHPDKLAKGGEDAFFFCSKRNNFGVSGGVSTSSNAGVFSRQLLKSCHQRMGSEKGSNLVEVLKSAVVEVGSLNIRGGSATVVLGQLKGNELSVLNLGDSGLYVLRPCQYEQRSSVR